MRIAIGCIGHETNTFSPVATGIDNFKQGTYCVGEEIVAEFAATSTIIGGFLERAADLGVEAVPLLWTFATPSGTVQQAAYETLKAYFLARLQEAGRLDGVFLDLHGAMVTQAHEDAEGDLLQAVREQVGDLPIVVTLDLHANITAAMAEYADVIIGFDTYPHVDCYERGLEGAQIIADMVAGEIRPTMAYRQLPLLTSPPPQCSMRPPMSEAIARLHELEARSGVVTATLSMGFPFADIHDAGCSVLVTTDGDQALAEECADEFAQYMWDRREAFRAELVSVQEAIEFARKSEGQPVVLAEGSDNPGGGGPCDGTHILRALIAADFQGAVVAIIADPESVARAIAAGVGEEVELEVGGKSIALHGEPVALCGYVQAVTDGNFQHKGPMARGKRAQMGRTAVVRVGGVEIILTEQRLQPFDAEVLRSVGIEPVDRKLIALKSAVHFRADYTPIAHAILEVDTPGVHSPNLSSYDYKKVRAVYPLSGEVVDWR
ncbi:MAG: M81 family metallopeptidase [Gemmatimonadetes bacterium]|nr:M81 family metallopeptidase [Gemmatimonadota bacterium]MBT6907538.1 M81 family metallopeptidase [Gemmatimonadota bacterium]